MDTYALIVKHLKDVENCVAFAALQLISDLCVFEDAIVISKLLFSSLLDSLAVFRSQ